MTTDKQEKVNEQVTTNKRSDSKFNKNTKFNKDNRKPGFKSKKINEPQDDFIEVVAQVRRVTKVTKGGRRFRFATVVVVGDKKGQVGFATGKANEVPGAIKKAAKKARRNLITVRLKNGTVPHKVLAKFGASEVLIKPAKSGTGLIAGGPARIVVELAGLHDVYTKSLGSKTPLNMIRATINGLKSLRTIEEVAQLRDKTVAEIKG